jgi:hypothetical protein
MRDGPDWPAAGPSTAKERRFPAEPTDDNAPRIRPAAALGAAVFGGGEEGARPGNNAVAVHTASDHVVHFRPKDGTRPGGNGRRRENARNLRRIIFRNDLFSGITLDR